MTNRPRGNVVLWLLLAAAAVFIFAVLVILPREEFFGRGNPLPEGTPINPEYKTFASCQAIVDTLAAAEKDGQRIARDASVGAPEAAPQATSEAGSTSLTTSGFGGGSGGDYTQTNIQVEGVDEPDVVKNDGEFLYTLSKNQIHIVDANPAPQAQRLASIAPAAEDSFAQLYLQDFFINGNRLVAFGSRYVSVVPSPDAPPPTDGLEPLPVPDAGGGSGGRAPEADVLIAPEIYPFPGGFQVAVALVYDITDRANPSLVRSLEFEGGLLTSRLIDGRIYLVLQSYPAYRILAADAPGGTFLPRFREAGYQTEPGEATTLPTGEEGFVPAVPCGSVTYLDPIIEQNFLTVASFTLSDPATVSRNVVLGAGGTVYASRESLYVAGTDWSGGIVQPLAVDRFRALPAPEIYRETSVLHAFGLAGPDITYRGNTRIPGHVLNQFSMDEHKGTFRVATTENRWGADVMINDEQGGPVNALTLLDAETLDRLGTVDNLAPGETIYAARFLGDRAYLVTFRQVDPLFVFDLSDPHNPRTLGQLKVPGYSNYLHPFNADGSLLIGVGKNAEADEQRGFAWYQGMKLALFDATDPQNPRELHTVDIGDRGTDSPTLYDHKAFLFDPSRNLLVLPIQLAVVSDSLKSGAEPERFAYGNFTYQGSFVYRLTAEEGFVEQGRVSHMDDPAAYFSNNGFAPGYSDLFVRRNTRIGDVLWSISDGKLVGSNLVDNLTTVATVTLPPDESSGRDALPL